MAKNIQSISRLLWECPHPGLQNEPPLYSLDPQSPNPFMASPSPDPIQRLVIKGFGDGCSRLSSGSSFRSSGWGRFRSSLDIVFGYSQISIFREVRGVWRYASLFFLQVENILFATLLHIFQLPWLNPWGISRTLRATLKETKYWIQLKYTWNQ